MKYKVLNFDADETLFDFKKAEKEAFKETIVEFGIDYAVPGIPAIPSELIVITIINIT